MTKLSKAQIDMLTTIGEAPDQELLFRSMGWPVQVVKALERRKIVSCTWDGFYLKMCKIINDPIDSASKKTLLDAGWLATDAQMRRWDRTFRGHHESYGWRGALLVTADPSKRRKGDVAQDVTT